MAKVKSMWKSKTVWGGILLALAGGVTALGQLLVGEIEPQAFATSLAMMAKGLWDVYNRFKTTQPIV